MSIRFIEFPFFPKVAENFHLVAHWNRKNGLKLTKGKIQTSAPVFRTHSRCSDVCGPGHTPVFRYPGKKCCWDCVPCAHNTVKDNRSMTTCTRCPEYHGSNGRRDRCVPLSAGDVRYLSRESLVVCVSSLAGVHIF